MVEKKAEGKHRSTPSQKTHYLKKLTDKVYARILGDNSITITLKKKGLCMVKIKKSDLLVRGWLHSTG